VGPKPGTAHESFLANRFTWPLTTRTSLLIASISSAAVATCFASLLRSTFFASFAGSRLRGAKFSGSDKPSSCGRRLLRTPAAPTAPIAAVPATAPSATLTSVPRPVLGVDCAALPAGLARGLGAAAAFSEPLRALDPERARADFDARRFGPADVPLTPLDDPPFPDVGPPPWEGVSPLPSLPVVGTGSSLRLLYAAATESSAAGTTKVYHGRLGVAIGMSVGCQAGHCCARSCSTCCTRIDWISKRYPIASAGVGVAT
jgi:hypothetical protein